MMKQCPYCVKSFKETAVQCPYCGIRLVTVKPPRPKVFVKHLVVAMMILVGLLLIPLSKVIFNKSAEQAAKIEPLKVNAPHAPAPEPVAASDPVPASEPAQTPVSADKLNNNAFDLCSSKKCTDPQKAIQYLNEAIKLKPDFAEAYNNRGCVYRILDQHQRAIEDYSEAIRLKPDLADAYNNRGGAYRNLDQQQRAIEDYSEAIRLKPDLAEAYSNRGGIYLMQGNKELGCRDVQKACALGNCLALEIAKGRELCR